MEGEQVQHAEGIGPEVAATVASGFRGRGPGCCLRMSKGLEGAVDALHCFFEAGERRGRRRHF